MVYRRVIATFLFLLLSTQFAAAQPHECAILLFAEGESRVTSPMLYTRHGDSYLLTDVWEIPDGHGAYVTGLSPDRRMLTLSSSSDTIVRLVSVTSSGFTYVGILSNDRVQPRRNAWSNDNARLLLHNIFGNRNDQLIVYDLNSDEYYFPTNLSEVFYATWSPDSQTIAFVAYNLDYLSDPFRRPPVNRALYVTNVDGTPIRTIPIADDEPSRYQWLSDSELAVTSCAEDSCVLHIYDVTSDAETVIDLGGYLLEGYVFTLDSYLLTSISQLDKNIYLRTAGNGETVQISHVDYLISHPIVSPDERYIAYRADLDGAYKLFVDDLAARTNVAMIELQGARPDFLVGNNAGLFPYDFYFIFDDWHPDGDRLLFEDNNVTYIHNVHTGASEVAVSPIANLDFYSPRWVC